MALVEAERFSNSFEAGMAQARLAAAGIPSFPFDQELNWAGGAFPVRLMVDDEDLDAAREVLAD